MVKIFPESEFTHPTASCGHPERWHAVDASSAEVEVSALVGALVTAMRPNLVVETGSHVGRTSRVVGEALRGAGRGRLVTIEVEPDLAADAARRCTDLPVDVVCASSVTFVPNENIDLLWCDTRPDMIVLEIRHFLPWMSAATLIGVHGTARGGATIVDRLVDEGMITQVLHLDTPRGVALARPSFAALETFGHA
jgi:predicted O-methyltransferase YrrM